MTLEQKVMIRILSVALGKDSIEQPPKGIEWKKVAELVNQQEMSALMFDGYQKIYKQIREQALSRIELLEWIGQTNYLEEQNKQQIQTEKELASLFDEKGLLTFALKGVTIAQYYPNPNHRFSCDFDCFLVKDGTSAQEEGNKIVEDRGIKVDRSYYKNSSFIFKGLHVENHRYCCSIKRGKRTADLEKYLESLLCNYTPEYFDDTKLALPPLLFQALFLIEHACGHFLYEKMSLKNICDWACFRKVNIEQLDWEEFNKVSEKYGLREFVYTMNHLADFILGNRQYSELSKVDRMVLEDTLKIRFLPQNKVKQRLWKTIGILHSGWKFKHFSSDSMLKELWNSVYAYLFDKSPVLD